MKTTVLIALLTLVAVNVGAKEVGVIMWTGEDHYSTTLAAAQQEIKQQGLKVNYHIRFANGNKAIAMQIAKEFSQMNLDAIMPIGTSAALIAQKELPNKPIVFGMIFDPVSAGVVKSWGVNIGNTTGASAKVSQEYLLKQLVALNGTKRLGVLYVPNEKNSEAVVKELQKNRSGLKIVPVPIPTKESLAILNELPGTVDALYIAGGTIIGANLESISEMVAKSGIVTVGHIEYYSGKGVILTVYPPAKECGKATGKIMAQVLKGKAPSTIPVWQIKTPETAVNMKMVRLGNVKVNNINAKIVE